MTSSTPWHAGEALLRALADGVAPPAAAASAEAHLLRCAGCREQLTAFVARRPLEDVWSRVREVVEAPAPSPLERFLRVLGVRPETGRLLAAVPAFRGSWLLGTACALLFAAVAAAYAGAAGLAVFLVAAPLAPVAGVAAAYGPSADPSFEVTAGTPYSAGRLLLLRTGGVLATSLPVCVLAGLLLPGPALLGAAWLLPALAFVAVTLAAAPLAGVPTTAGGVGALWAAAVLAATWAGAPLLVVAPLAQLLFAVAAGAGLAVLVARRRATVPLGRHP